jgi:hypothetical protein
MYSSIAQSHNAGLLRVELSLFPFPYQNCTQSSSFISMLPLLILVGTPAALGTCYGMFNQGQSAVLSSPEQESPPPGTGLSYASSLMALAGTYGAQGYAIRTLEDGTEAAAQQAKQKAGDTMKTAGSSFKQPQNIGEFMTRAGKPMLLHFGAISVAFFVAGAVQSSVAKSSSRRRGSTQL